MKEPRCSSTALAQQEAAFRIDQMTYIILYNRSFKGFAYMPIKSNLAETGFEPVIIWLLMDRLNC